MSSLVLIESLVPFSVGLIMISLLLAFVPLTRVIVSLIFDLAWTKFITTTGIYTLWLRLGVNGRTLIQWRLNMTDEWKKEIRHVEQERQQDNVDPKEKWEIEKNVAGSLGRVKRHSNWLNSRRGNGQGVDLPV